MIKSLLVLLALIKCTLGLACLQCSSMERNCGLTVAKVFDVSSVSCASRCYIRTNSTGAITRGCIDDLNVNFDYQIPDNGCAIHNNVYWCWCNGSDFCNDDSIRITLIDPNSSISCDKLRCLNGGVCTKNVYTKDRFFCLCKPQYSGPDCSLRIN
ncbi:hypothetical protein BpHYR1_021405 [Brachionus plicatilis]|uniref:EGF-like domain-containing protein n=1 Tax=Brachionus plicatilis TaxID=10195 RepID=A0A3M7PYN7_BRAPC|nr:hypothetical protein BpHYR1_021405 [Brachionus plicatilis]